ncbi:hypothetical protein [Microcystis phage Mwe-Yong1]|nr:hypothetical protein [Microcystis phage Mwe-Yong1]
MPIVIVFLVAWVIGCIVAAIANHKQQLFNLLGIVMGGLLFACLVTVAFFGLDDLLGPLLRLVLRVGV